MGWLASQASVFSSLAATPGAAPALRHPGRGDGQEPSPWAGGSRLSAPEKGGVAGSPGPSGEVTNGVHRFRIGGRTGCLGFSRICPPPPGRKGLSPPKTDATTTGLQPQPGGSRPEPAAGAWPGRGLEEAGPGLPVPQRRATCLRSTYDGRWGRQPFGRLRRGAWSRGHHGQNRGLFLRPGRGQLPLR